jgi:hypothetical protein
VSLKVANEEQQVALTLMMFDNGISEHAINSTSFKHTMRITGGNAAVMTPVASAELANDVFIGVMRDIDASIITAGNVVSATCDHWSENKRSALGVTVHHVSKQWQMMSDVIALVPSYDVKLTGDNTQLLFEAALETGLNGNVSVFCLTTDNGASMVKASNQISDGKDAGVR